MRLVTAMLMGASLISLMASVPALAQAAPPAATEIATPLATDHPVRAAIEARLVQLRTSLRSGPERTWLDELSSLYAARDHRPIWLKASGDLTAARKAAGEIARADDWGLDASQFKIPDLSLTPADATASADAEVQLSLATLAYIAHARGHRVDPSQLSKWLDQRPRPVAAYEVGFVADADDPAVALQRQHPQHPQFEKLRQAYLKLRGGESIKTPAAVLPVQFPASGPRLKNGTEHADVAILRERLGVKASDPDDAETYDNDVAKAVRAFQRKAGLKATGVVTAQVRAALNAGDGQGASTARKGSPTELRKILVNMERWRWLPENLGSTYVWNNLPEFETRVIKSGEVIHQERIVIGKIETQTPVFSDKMRFVVFQPDWGIPNSIKITDLWPKVRGGDSGVIERRDMRVYMNGRPVSSSRIDWQRIDIREVEIRQNPGASNPLGQMKFMFPNKHDVYMHDTPSKHLFNSSVRTFSHGCIRVRNPRALAELVFKEDRGLSPQEVATSFMGASRPNNKVDLTRSIDVHNTYFTVVVNEDGSLKSLPDIYGHDRRIQMALEGTPAAVIARDDPAVRHEQSVKAKRMEIVSRPQLTRQAMDDDDYPRPRSNYRAKPQWNGFFGLGFN
jgi:murein L,D-transpeptidase YcbB/YkuD